MNHLASAEEQIVNERLKRKLNDVNLAARAQLYGIQDLVNFTLQQAYFRCAYECLDRRSSEEEIRDCIEHCTVPIVNAQHLIEIEMARFQGRLQRYLTVCQDKFEAAKLQQIKTEAVDDFESCVDQSIQESISTLPT